MRHGAARQHDVDQPLLVRLQRDAVPALAAILQPDPRRGRKPNRPHARSRPPPHEVDAFGRDVGPARTQVEQVHASRALLPRRREQEPVFYCRRSGEVQVLLHDVPRLVQIHRESAEIDLQARVIDFHDVEFVSKGRVVRLGGRPFELHGLLLADRRKLRGLRADDVIRAEAAVPREQMEDGVAGVRYRHWRRVGGIGRVHELDIRRETVAVALRDTGRRDRVRIAALDRARGVVRPGGGSADVRDHDVEPARSDRQLRELRRRDSAVVGAHAVRIVVRRQAERKVEDECPVGGLFDVQLGANREPRCDRDRVADGGWVDLNLRFPDSGLRILRRPVVVRDRPLDAAGQSLWIPGATGETVERDLTFRDRLGAVFVSGRRRPPQLDLEREVRGVERTVVVPVEVQRHDVVLREPVVVLDVNAQIHLVDVRARLRRGHEQPRGMRVRQHRVDREERVRRHAAPASVGCASAGRGVGRAELLADNDPVDRDRGVDHRQTFRKEDRAHRRGYDERFHEWGCALHGAFSPSADALAPVKH